MRKRLLLFVFFIMLFVSSAQAYAADINNDKVRDTIIYCDDGSYTVISMQTYKTASGSTKTASKSAKHYNTSNVLQWTFKVTGTFTYNGTSATATAVTTSYTISNNSWSFDHATKSKVANAVAATGYFTKSGKTKSGTVTIKCSKTGVIS